MKYMPKDADPMDVLRTCVSALDFYDKEGHHTDRESAMHSAVKITGQIGTIAAAWDRIRNGKDPVSPDPSLGIAENFLYMLRGEKADADEARMFDIALILHADHELNASTFTTRVVAGTLADMYGAVTAGIAALAGPLHGGANTAVMKMLIEIGDPAKIDAWVDDALEHKKKIMGIGHAVYKTEDPRATWLRKFSKQMAEKKGESKWFDMSQRIEKADAREEGHASERRLLFRIDLLPDGNPARSLHPDLRRQPYLRLDRPHPRTIREQQADPPACRVHRQARSEVCSDRGEVSKSKK
jgi:citrate synthase